jgi:hypothetical protein
MGRQLTPKYAGSCTITRTSVVGEKAGIIATKMFQDDVVLVKRLGPRQAVGGLGALDT